MANVPISAFTVPANTVGIGATGYSLTGSASASFMDLAGTWNTSGTPTAIKLNITDTSSPAGSLLMDLQVGGASFGSLAKNGTLTAGRYAASGFSGMQFNASTGVIGLSRSADGAVVTSWNANSNSFNVGTATVSATLVLGGSTDLLLTRRGAANLRLGAADAAAPVAQTLSVQSVVAGTTNTAGTNFTFTGSQGTGTGAGGSLIFQVAPAGSSGSAQNALATALTINSARNLIVAGNIFNTDGVSGIQPNTGSIFYVDAPGSFIIRNNASAFAQMMAVGAGGLLTLGPTGTQAALIPDAANTLALRNATAAQRFNVYNTWSSSTNYEAFKIDWITTANTVLVGTEKGSGGGTARALAFQTDGTTRLTIATDGSLTLTGSGTASIANSAVVGNNNSLLLTASNYVAAETANFSLLSTGTRSFWIERTTGQHMVSGFSLGWSSSATNSAVSDDTILAREAAGVTAIRGANTTTGGALGFIEQTAPTSPAANGVRIYAEDNGSGKTRLMALFATGAAQQIAIEP
jgi:hypothetical protein